MTPEPIGPAEWSSLHALLVILWLFTFLTASFALSLLMGHAVTPSLVFTKQLSSLPGWFLRLMRPMFYLVAIVVLGFDIYVGVWLATHLRPILDFWPRVWI